MAILFLSSVLYSQPQIPQLNKYANDQTNTLKDSQLKQLSSELKKFDDKTSNQVVFLMVRTLEDYPIEMYTQEVAEQNKIGTKGNDNGVLFCVVKDDRKMRIEVGYGLEGALPDALASSIIRNEIAPYFKRDDYYSGVVAGLSAIVSATMGEYTRTDRRERDDDSGGFPFGYLIFIILILIFGRGRGGGFGSFLLLSALGGASGGHRSSGFGGGGGFGGGFSGGGGSFGGGGASGGW
ncbi:MAG: TPM domain-containing protein [Bacteroidota bacterium]